MTNAGNAGISVVEVEVSEGTPTIRGNNTTNVEVIGDAPLQGDGTNEICEDAPTE